MGTNCVFSDCSHLKQPPFWIHHHLCTRRNDLETDCELLWCEVMVTNPLRNLLVGVFYRPPSTDQSYLQEMEKSLALVERNGSNLTTVLLGDFNVPGLIGHYHHRPVEIAYHPISVTFFMIIFLTNYWILFS